jgi:hypothetical protein
MRKFFSFAGNREATRIVGEALNGDPVIVGPMSLKSLDYAPYFRARKRMTRRPFDLAFSCATRYFIKAHAPHVFWNMNEQPE